MTAFLNLLAPYAPLIKTGLFTLALTALFWLNARARRRADARLASALAALERSEQRLGSASDENAMLVRDTAAEGFRSASEQTRGAFLAEAQSRAAQLESIERQLHAAAERQDAAIGSVQIAVTGAFQHFEQRVAALEQSTAERLQQNENRVESMRRTLAEGLEALRADNARKLDEMQQTVDQKLTDTLDKRLTQSFSQVSERLAQVYQGLGEMQALSAGVGDLKRVLSNVKTRGVWGEVQLQALIAQVMSDSQYERNVAVRPDSQERVEFALRLPGREDGGRPVYLPIDSKFPQEDYARLTEASEAGDAQATETARRALIAAVRREAARIGKYVAPPYSTDFAVMFLPMEGLYAEVTRDAAALQAIQRDQRVVIAGPNTLYALLNSLQMGFQTLAVEKRSAEVWELLGHVRTDFDRFARELESTQTRLHQANDAIERAVGRTRGIQRRLRDVSKAEEVGGGEGAGLVAEDAGE